MNIKRWKSSSFGICICQLYFMTNIKVTNMIEYSREICQQNMDNEQNVSDQWGKNWFQQCSLKAVLLLAEEGVNSIGDCQLPEATPPSLETRYGPYHMAPADFTRFDSRAGCGSCIASRWTSSLAPPPSLTPSMLMPSSQAHPPPTQWACALQQRGNLKSSFPGWPSHQPLLLLITFTYSLSPTYLAGQTSKY